MGKVFGHAGTLVQVLEKNKRIYLEAGINFDGIIESLLKLEVNFYLAIIRYSRDMVLGFSINFDMDAKVTGNYLPTVNVYRLDNYGNTLGQLSKNVTNPLWLAKAFPELVQNKTWYFRKPLFQPDGSFTHNKFTIEEAIECNNKLNEKRVRYGYDTVNLDNEIWFT